MAAWISAGLPLSMKWSTLTSMKRASARTATGPSGGYLGDGCVGFTSTSPNAPYASVGISGRTDGTWSNAYLQFCDRAGLRLYCFEQ